MDNIEKIEISRYSDAVDRIISENIPISTISGPPGSGKTAEIPPYLANLGKSVFVVIPTKIAVENAKNYIKSEDNNRLNRRLKDSVGFAANSIVEYENAKIENARGYLYGYETTIMPNTQIVYCTPGHIMKVILDLIKFMGTFPRSNNINFCDYIIFDESHLETLDIDFSIRFIKYLKIVYGINNAPHIIKLSATPDSIEGEKHFSLEETQTRKRVAYAYIDQIDEYEGLIVPHSLTTDEPSFRDILFFIPNFISFYVDFLNESSKKSRASILVFLPGKKEIEFVSSNLKKEWNGKKKIGKYEILHAHSKIDQTSLSYVMKPKPENVRFRIILSTNIAETSITIPDVEYVIDSMLEKVSKKGVNGSIQINTSFISKSSAKQRTGRVARTSDGVSIRCCTVKKFKSLKDKNDSEIKRLPFATEILRSLNSNIDLNILLPDVSKSKIRSTLKDLSDICCIEKNGDFYRITKIGEFASMIPLAAKNSAFLKYWILKSDDAFPGIVAAVALEMIESLFPNVDPKSVSSVPIATILIPFIKLWRQNRGTFRPPMYRIKKFCTENNINTNSMSEALKKIKEISNIINLIDETIDTEPFEFDVKEFYSMSVDIFGRVCKRLFHIGDGKYIDKTELENFLSYNEYSMAYYLSSKYFYMKSLVPSEVYAYIFSGFSYNKTQDVILWVPINLETGNTFDPLKIDKDKALEEIENMSYDDSAENEDEETSDYMDDETSDDEDEILENIGVKYQNKQQKENKKDIEESADSEIYSSDSDNDEDISREELEQHFSLQNKDTIPKEKTVTISSNKEDDEDF